MFWRPQSCLSFFSDQGVCLAHGLKAGVVVLLWEQLQLSGTRDFTTDGMGLRKTISDITLLIEILEPDFIKNTIWNNLFI